MANFTLEDTLKTLTYHQAEVLYWTCEGLSNENIAARLGYSKDWVVWQMSFVYHKLGMDRKDQRTGKSMHWNQRREIIREKVCPVFRRLFNDDPDNLEIFPIIPPNVLEGSILDLRPEIPVPPSEPFTPPPEPPPDPPRLPELGLKPPSEPPPDFYPIELYNAWLAVLEDDRHGDPPPPPPTPVIIQPVRRGIMWGRILGLGFAVLLGCAVVAALAYWLGRGGTLSPATEPSLPAIQSTFTIEPSATIQSIDTETSVPSPTDTTAPTLTFTPTATITPVPTETKSPIGLRINDELRDNRVTLKFQEIKFEQGRTGTGQRPPAPIVFEFDFINHSGDTILLQIGQDQFRAEDNLGNQLTCEFWNGVTEAVENIQRPLENDQTFDLGVYCGEGRIPAGVTTYTLYVTGFSSLPDSTWIAEVRR
jgi:hypothetical protein